MKILKYKKLTRRSYTLFAVLIMLICVYCAKASVTSELAFQLFDESRYDAAAVEFRRLAIDSKNSPEAASWYWLGGYSYLLNGNLELAGKCADRAEEADSDNALSLEISELRGEIAYESGSWNSAIFHYESLVKKADDDPKMRLYAEEGIVASAFLLNKRDDAYTSASQMSGRAGEVEAILDKYYSTSQKKPWLGGLLGMIPGFGHFYSGEYGNGIRAMVLNGLFIWGMAESASEELWGVFAVITFGELTWYSGSIYGGIDAAHRYNRKLWEETVHQIRSAPPPYPDRSVLPLLSLSFEF